MCDGNGLGRDFEQNDNEEERTRGLSCEISYSHLKDALQYHRNEGACRMNNTDIQHEQGKNLRQDYVFLGIVILASSVISVLYWWATGWTHLDDTMSWMGFSRTFLDEGQIEPSFAALTTVYFAAWIWVFGDSVLVVKFAQLFVLELSVLAVYSAGRVLMRDRRAARVASLLLVSSPFVYQQTATAGYELLSILTLTCFVLLLNYAYERRTMWSAFLVGLLAAVGALVKAGLSALIIVAVLYLGIVLLSEKDWRAFLKTTAIAVIVFCIPVIAWMARNEAVCGYFALNDPAYSGFTWFHGNNPWATKGFPVAGDDATEEYYKYIERIKESVPPGDNAALGEAYREEVWKYIKSDPFNWFVILGFKKIWCGFKFYDRREILHWGPLLPLSAFGIWCLLKHGIHTLCVHFVLLYYVIGTYIFFGHSRYRFAYLPILMLLATASLLWVYDRVGRKKFALMAVGYMMIFVIAYAWARPLREIWLHYIPALRM